MSKLRETVAAKLEPGHLGSLELLELMKRHPPTVIYDIGAHLGTWSQLAKAVVPTARIHAFEPLAVHREGFRAATKDVPDIHLHEVALGAQAGAVAMQVTNLSDASSLLEVAGPSREMFGVTREREEEVRMVRLDDYVSQTHIARPDLMKLDVQGYEIEVLRGGEACLRQCRFVILEVSFVEFYRGQALFHDVVRFMHERGFHLHALSVDTPLGQPLVQTDGLFGLEQ